MTKVLIIDDEPHIRLLLRTALVRDGYEVIEAGAARGLTEGLDAKPEVVLLDLGLPDRDGLELVSLIKAKSAATLLVVSARDATEQKVAALDLGADDYLTKPFDTEELLARVRTALRHRMAMQGEQSAVRAGDVEIDLVKRRITRAGEELHLTPKEYEVVAALARYPGRVVTHAQLLDTVWTGERSGQIEYLRVLVRGIRQKLEKEPANPKIVRNELGVGYRLMDSNL